MRVIEDTAKGIPAAITAKRLKIGERTVYRDRATHDEFCEKYKQELFKKHKDDAEHGLRKSLRLGSPAMIAAFYRGSDVWKERIAVEHSGGITVDQADDIRANSILRVSKTKVVK